MRPKSSAVRPSIGPVTSGCWESISPCPPADGNPSCDSSAAACLHSAGSPSGRPALHVRRAHSGFDGGASGIGTVAL